jgi:TatD DNase family protein
MAKRLVNSDYYFTFGGVITFLPGRSQMAKEGSENYNEVVKYLPLDKIFVETDCPYVAPEPYRGKRNEPAYVIEVIRRLAQIKEMNFEKTAEAAYKNSLEMFNLKQ